MVEQILAGQGKQEIGKNFSATDEFLKQKGALERISFKDGQEHIITIKKDEIREITTPQGETKKGILYTVIENNESEEKTFFTTSVGLAIQIRKLLRIGKNKMRIQMRNRISGKSVKSYYVVKEV